MYHFHPCAKDKVGQEYPSPADFTAVVDRGLESEDVRLGIPNSVYEECVVTMTGVFHIQPDMAMIRANEEHSKELGKTYEERFKIYTSLIERDFADLSQAERSRRFADGSSSELVKISFVPFE